MNQYFWEGFEKRAAAPGPVMKGLKTMWGGAKDVGRVARGWMGKNPVKSAVGAGTLAAGAGYMAGRPSQPQTAFQNVHM